MTKYLKVDLQENYGISFCDTKEEVIEGCGYDVDEIFPSIYLATELSRNKL